MGKVNLKTMTVPAEVFDEILDTFSCYAVTVDEDEFNTYRSGYKRKKAIYTCGEYLICREFLLVDTFKKYKLGAPSSWKQIIIKRDAAADEPCYNMDGPRAFAYMKKILLNYYTDDEILERLEMFKGPINADALTIHRDYEFFNDPYKIHKFTNCYEYDINSAYGSLLIEIFPKAKEDIENLYIHRKETPYYKDVLNYTVGMFAHFAKDLLRKNKPLTREAIAYRDARNWIVYRIQRALNEAMCTCDGYVIYANTDGFVVKDPKHLLRASSKIGDFKLAYQGDFYTYRGKNFLCGQGNKIKGTTLPKTIRENIDLSKGIICSFSKERKPNGVKNGRQSYIEKIINVQYINEEIITHEKI